LETFVTFVYSLLFAVLFQWSGNGSPETLEEVTWPAHGVIAQNKAPSVIGCPVERYPVRFGRDDDAKLIDLSAVTRTTIETMRSWPIPAAIPPANRISPYETTALALDVTLIEYKKERDFDTSDYRLVLADDSGRTLIAKISSPECAEADSDEPGLDLPGSRFLEGIGFSRADFAARLSPTTTVKRLNAHVRVMGIGMFDLLSGQAGEAPNGIQICPVLDISFDETRIPFVHLPVAHPPRGVTVRR
jgi:hypothetical protein